MLKELSEAEGQWILLPDPGLVLQTVWGLAASLPFSRQSAVDAQTSQYEVFLWPFGHLSGFFEQAQHWAGSSDTLAMAVVGGV